MGDGGSVCCPRLRYDQSGVFVGVAGAIIERKDAVCPDCGSERAKYYKAQMRLIQCHGFGRLKAYVEVDVHRIYCPNCCVRLRLGGEYYIISRYEN